MSLPSGDAREAASPPAPRPSGVLTAVALYLGALVVRVAYVDQVLVGGRPFVFPDDPPYHLRRALLTLT